LVLKVKTEIFSVNVSLHQVYKWFATIEKAVSRERVKMVKKGLKKAKAVNGNGTN